MSSPRLLNIIYVMLAVSLFLGGCATTKLPPITAAEFTGFEDDEKRIWKRVEEGQEDLDESDFIYKDKKLEKYLNDVARKLQPPGVYKVIPFKVKVLKNAYMNAVTAPNGVIYFHTSLLARMENEAQLATVLAHEMTHATHRHGVRGFRSLKNKMAVLSTVQYTFGSLPGVNLVGALGTTAAVTGYSRDLEREADNVGMDLMVKAGYDPTEAPKHFEFLLQELEDEDVKEPFFFSSHPKLKDRIESYNTLLSTKYAGHKGGKKNTKKFLRMTRNVMLDNAELDIKLGRFEVAKRGVEKYLASWKNHSRPYYILGEIARQKGGEGSDEEAIKQYKKAISLNSKNADAHKALGMIYFKKGKKSKAKKSLKKYLSLAKNASDKAFIKEYIKQCK